METVLPEKIRKMAEEAERQEQADIDARKQALEDGGEGAGGGEPTPTPAPTPQPPQGDVAKRLAELEAELAKERQRNESLQGLIKKQGPEMAETIRKLKAEIDDLKKANEKPAEPPMDPRLKHLNEDERSLYKGEQESVEVRMARGIAEAEIEKERQARKKLEERLAAIESTAVTAVRDNVTDKFMQEVEVLLPGATRINAEDSFDSWLDKPDPRSRNGGTYRDRGVFLMSRQDATGVADLMKEYLEGNPEVSAELMSQVKPVQSRIPESGGPTKSKPVVQESEIAAFYKDKATGNLRNADGSKMSKEDADRIETEIESAMKDGRVRPG